MQNIWLIFFLVFEFLEQFFVFKINSNIFINMAEITMETEFWRQWWMKYSVYKAFT